MTLATAVVAAVLWARSCSRLHVAVAEASPSAAHTVRNGGTEWPDDVELRRLMA